ncbi:hypothetical protein [Bacillus sp. TE8-1]|uniref:hypothetical protein n=1 Tax=Bacillus sp. TE8-1 TaxID=2217829 RepID=UPI002102735E|nr:hypothetical protein [Bacillus sp. TE8-1]
MDMKEKVDSVENALIFENQKNNLIDESVISNNINGLTATDAVSRIDLSGYKSAIDAVSKISSFSYLLNSRGYPNLEGTDLII